MTYSSMWQDLLGVEFSQRWIDAGNVRTRVLEAGDKNSPALVFIHGTGGHAEAYVRNIGAHAEHFHVYAIDMVGHGFSDKPAQSYDFRDYARHLLDFADAEGLDKISVSGESMGAGIGAWFALLYPDRMEKLVLNTGAALRLPDDVIKRMATLTMNAVRTADWESVKARLEWLMSDASKVTDDMIATRLKIYRSPDYLERMDDILRARHTDPAGQDRNCLVEADWNKVQAPTLVLWTDHDPTAPPEVGKQVADWIPNSRFELMLGSGHWPQFEDADTFNKLHIDFLLGK